MFCGINRSEQKHRATKRYVLHRLSVHENVNADANEKENV